MKFSAQKPIICSQKHVIGTTTIGRISLELGNDSIYMLRFHLTYEDSQGNICGRIIDGCEMTKALLTLIGKESEVTT